MEQSAALDKLISHYSENFELSRNVEIAGITVPVAASMRHRGELSIMGFGTGKQGPEACEHVFMLETESFDDGLMEKISVLIEEAEREYVTPGKDHAYTFLSVVALAAKVQGSAAALLKKYKYRRDYGKNGWIVARAAVIAADGTCFSNKDGSDLKKLVLNILNTKGE